MNLIELNKRLLAAARRHPPSNHVPYAFEKRIMARLTAQPLLDTWTFLTRGFWRAATPCIVVAVLLGGWALFAPLDNATTGTLSQDFENTVLAAVYQDGSIPW